MQVRDSGFKNQARHHRKSKQGYRWRHKKDGCPPKFFKQEYIPVVYVPPASMVISTRGCLPRESVSASGGEVSAWGGVCQGEGCVQGEGVSGEGIHGVSS